MELKDIREKLNEIKQDEALWNEFAYRKNDAGYGCDQNGLKRYALIIELQYDPGAPEALVRYLMEHETAMHRNSPYKGIHMSLKIISYLLAKFRNVENIWLFDRAKTANFDTYTGLEAEHLYCAGVAKTAAYIDVDTLDARSSFYRIRNSLRTLFTEADIEKWFKAKEAQFPSRREKESLRCLVDRAITLKNYAEGELMLQKLAESFEGPDTNYAILYQRAKELRAYNKAMYYLTKKLEGAVNPFDRAAALADMVEVHLIKQDYINAEAKLALCEAELLKFGEWKAGVQGRNLTALLLNISLGCSSKGKQDLAQKAFALATELVRHSDSYTSEILEEGRRCAEILALEPEIAYYDSLLHR